MILYLMLGSLAVSWLYKDKGLLLKTGKPALTNDFNMGA